MSFFSAMPVLSANNGPLYLQLGRLLHDAIQDGRLVENDALPPERDLADHYGVSRVTVRKALTELETGGWIVRRHGMGTFVASQKDSKASASSFPYHGPFNAGRDIRSVWLTRRMDVVTPDEAMTFGVPIGTRVCHLHRLCCHENTKVAVERSIILSTRPTPEILTDEVVLGVIEHTRLDLARALQRLRAVALPDDIADILGVTAGSPGLYLERRGFLRDGRTAELTRTWYASDNSDLVAEVDNLSSVWPSSASPSAGPSPAQNLQWVANRDHGQTLANRSQL